MCLTTLFFSFFLILLLLRATLPLPLAGLFFAFVILSTVSSFVWSSDFIPYMIYLIYVGGLLVLVVYMVIISTNYQLMTMANNSLMTIIIFCSLLTFFLYSMSFFPPYALDKNLSSTGSFELSNSALVLLVVFLLFSFMYICESIRVGGRSLKISKKIY